MKISRVKAMKMHCAECMGWYQDGKVDCMGHLCPLYHWMPFRDKKKVNLWWLEGRFDNIGKLKDLYEGARTRAKAKNQT